MKMKKFLLGIGILTGTALSAAIEPPVITGGTPETAFESEGIIAGECAYANALLEQVVESLADIRSQLQKTETKAQERIQTDMDMLRFISRIDHNVNQIDKRSEARQETLLREVRDSFKLLVRTISGQDK